MRDEDALAAVRDADALAAVRDEDALAAVRDEDALAAVAVPVGVALVVAGWCPGRPAVARWTGSAPGAGRRANPGISQFSRASQPQYEHQIDQPRIEWRQVLQRPGGAHLRIRTPNGPSTLP